MAVARPTWKPRRPSLQPAQHDGIVHLTEYGVAKRPHRMSLVTRMQQLLVLEGHNAASAGLLTERPRCSLIRHRTRPVTTEEPGELACVDAFCKGVGKLWQTTACHAASSYTMARLIVPATQWRQDPSCGTS